MADITSKTAMGPATPTAAAIEAVAAAAAPEGAADSQTPQAAAAASSLPNSIHTGLSEKLHGLTEKLQSLGGGGSGAGGGRGGDAESTRSRTSKDLRKCGKCEQKSQNFDPFLFAFRSEENERRGKGRDLYFRSVLFFPSPIKRSKCSKMKESITT